MSVLIEKKNLDASNSSGARADFMYRNILDQKRYIHILGYVNQKHILDCACGVGWGSFLMAKAGARHVVGIDLSSEALSTAKKYYNDLSIEYIHDNIYNYSNSHKFDVITSFETLEHLEDPLKFLKKVSSLSHAETMFFLSTPNGFCFKYKTDFPYNPYHKNEFTKEELINLFNLSGWAVDEYLGQYPMEEGSEKINEYRNFIKSFWIEKKRSKTYGLIYKIFGKVYRRLMGKRIKEPAHSYDCSPKKIISGFQPAYHYFKLKLKNND